MMQPFKDLSQGQATARRSIDATYTAVPPPLALWRAFGARHFVLVVVCSTALLANVLALSMGALFNEEPTRVEMPGSLKPNFAPRIKKALADVYREEGRDLFAGPKKPHVVLTQANITDDLALPPWTTPNYYFRPGRLVDLPKAQNYTIVTEGFGLDANCTAYPEHEIEITPPKASKYPIRCNETLHNMDRTMRNDLASVGFDLDATGNAKYTYTRRWSADFLDDEETTLECDPTFFWGWGRTKDAGFRNSSASVSKVECRPKFQTATFNVSVDADGNVLSYNRTSKLSVTLADRKSMGRIRMMINMLHDGGLTGPAGWFNDTSYHGVWDMLLVQLTNSTATIDPSLPPPDTEAMLPAMEQIYRQLFVSVLALNTGVFGPATPEDAISGVAHVEEIRIFMNTPAFIITIVILGINLLATLLFYAQADTLALPRLPTTIGSIIAYIAPSRLVVEGKVDSATYSFGRYLGHDGKAHIGIEQDPYVVPIIPGSLEGRQPLLAKLGWRKGRSDDAIGPWM